MADDVVRIVTVVNWARGSVHGSTRSDEQAQDWVRRLAAANPGVLLAASQTVDTIDVSAEVAAAESRGRAAGYAEAVQALSALVEANYHPASSHGVLLRSVVARMEKLAAASRATTEETPR